MRTALLKLQGSDLLITRAGKSKTIVRNEYVSDYVWGNDGKSLAISKLGKLVVYDWENDREQVIALQDIDAQLDSHVARCVEPRRRRGGVPR